MKFYRSTAHAALSGGIVLLSLGIQAAPIATQDATDEPAASSQTSATATSAIASPPKSDVSPKTSTIDLLLQMEESAKAASEPQSSRGTRLKVGGAQPPGAGQDNEPNPITQFVKSTLGREGQPPSTEAEPRPDDNAEASRAAALEAERAAAEGRARQLQALTGEPRPFLNLAPIRFIRENREWVLGASCAALVVAWGAANFRGRRRR